MNSNINSNKKSNNFESKDVKNQNQEKTIDDKKTTDNDRHDRRHSTTADDEMRRVYIRAPPNRHVNDIHNKR